MLDIGAGGADVARDLLRRAQRDRVPLEVVAIDPDPRAAWWALRQTPTPGLTVRRAHSSDLVDEFMSGEPTSDGGLFDLVISNHVLHHLDGHELGVL
ncbi:MAG: methyltransferase domain-containing protein, partial [Pseudomonas sp.]|nr:methyltransferase domain-containing protein [Pseudomonas sp.]